MKQEEEEEELQIKRVWGSWEIVHPASAGTSSQVFLFVPADFNPTVDHPGSYAVHTDIILTLI